MNIFQYLFIKDKRENTVFRPVFSLVFLLCFYVIGSIDYGVLYIALYSLLLLFAVFTDRYWNFLIRIFWLIGNLIVAFILEGIIFGLLVDTFKNDILADTLYMVARMIALLPSVLWSINRSKLFFKVMDKPKMEA